jgi:PiT family inorganic phosphate transporter
LDGFHFASAGAASFARGLNDTPKIVAILLLVPEAKIEMAFAFVAIFILLGGIFDAKNVAETLGKKITDLDAGEGLVASFITSLLVSTASFHSLPVSTTHVSVGSLVGIGMANGKARWRMIGEIVLAWLTTVPCGLILGMIVYLLCSLSGLAR